MNIALDSPLDALDISYLSYGFLTAVNSIWAWVALVTAAVSFWRIRALSSSPLVSRSERRSTTRDAASTSTSLPPKMLPVKAAQPAARVPTPAAQKAAVLLNPVMTTRECSLSKVKFSVHYYNDDGFKGSDDERDEVDGSRDGGVGVEAAVVNEKLGVWCGDFESVIAVRMGDMGWYRCQDLTVLDGSVVRLWDGRRRRDAAALVADGGVL